MKGCFRFLCPPGFRLGTPSEIPPVKNFKVGVLAFQSAHSVHV